MPRPDKRIHRGERNEAGACVVCLRRHIHKDECDTLKWRLLTLNQRRVLRDERGVDDRCVQCSEAFAHQADCTVYVQRGAIHEEA